jgi:hypothetical protein
MRKRFPGEASGYNDHSSARGGCTVELFSGSGVIKNQGRGKAGATSNSTGSLIFQRVNVMNRSGTRINVTMPQTMLGRVIAAVLTVVAVVLGVFFFTAVVIVVAIIIASFLIRSAFAGKTNRTRIKPDEVTAEYEVLDDEEQSEEETGQRLLPRNSPVNSGPRKDTNK